MPVKGGRVKGGEEEEEREGKERGKGDLPCPSVDYLPPSKLPHLLART